MDKEIICKCGKTFTRKSKSRRKYCFECRPEEYKYTTTKTKELVCTDCGKPFARNIKSKFKRCKECQEKLVIEKTLEKAVVKKNKRPKIQKACISCNEQFEIVQSRNSRSRKKCDKCKEEEKKKIKIVQSRKVICSKCSNAFESDRVYLRCNKCNAYLLECEECKKIFERESKYSKNKICDGCEVEIEKQKAERLKTIEKNRLKGIELRKNILASRIKAEQDKCINCKNKQTLNEKIDFCDKCKEIQNIKREKRKFDGIENFDYVVCRICNEKKESLERHLKTRHNLTCEQYRKNYGENVPTRCLKLSKTAAKKISNTVKKQWQNGTYNNSLSFNDINEPEKLILSFSNKLVFVGGNKKDYKRFWIRTSRLRNPDFVSIEDEGYFKSLENKEWFEKQDQIAKDFLENKIKIKKVVEHNGFYWHKLRFNGKTLEEYEKEMIEDYKIIGIDCLVIWDFELENKEFVQNKINKFLL